VAATYTPVPEERNRRAGENAAHEGPQSVGNDDAEHSPAYAPDGCANEELKKLEQYGDLDKRKTGIVDDYAGPEWLECGEHIDFCRHRGPLLTLSM
jgi:hypothetical protein